MKATLQVLGFLLSLARGSEMGNSQAGKPRGEHQQAGSGERDLRARRPWARGFGFCLAELGGATPSLLEQAKRGPCGSVLRMGWAGTAFLDAYPSPQGVGDPLIALFLIRLM